MLPPPVRVWAWGRPPQWRSCSPEALWAFELWHDDMVEEKRKAAAGIKKELSGTSGW